MVPRIISHPKYNPSPKANVKTRETHPETAVLRKEFFDDLNKYDIKNAKNEPIESVLEKFYKIESHFYDFQNFQWALARLDKTKHLRAVQLNLQECLRRKAIVNGLDELFFYVSEAKKYDAIEKPEVEAILNHALVRYLVHHIHHLKSPFSLPAQEAKFATILKATCDFFFAKFAQNEEILTVFQRTVRLLAKFCEDLHEKELSLPNLVTLFVPLARYNATYIYKKVDVAKLKIGDIHTDDLFHKGSHSVFFRHKSVSEATRMFKLSQLNPLTRITENSSNELKIYKALENVKGFQKVVPVETEQTEFSVLEMEYLGPSLKQLLEVCESSFSLKTGLLLFLQMLDIVSELHTRKIVHSQLRPAHFLIGREKKRDTLYLVDFKFAINPEIDFSSLLLTKRQLSYLDFEFKAVCKDESYKEDLESLCFILVFMLKGTLPWLLSGQEIDKLDELDDNERSKIFAEIETTKAICTIEELCSGLPSEIGELLTYARGLNKFQQPNYQGIKEKFRRLFERMFGKIDNVFDWDYIENPVIKLKYSVPV